MTNRKKRKRFVNDLMEWGESNTRSFPWRDGDVSPYEVLIAEIFLKQTRAPTVDRIYRDFMSQFPSTESIKDADHSEIIDIIRPLGLYNHRADAFKEIANKLDQGQVPESESSLRELPQVGDYIANAVLCFAFDRDRAIIDTNVRRVYSRVFGEHAGEQLDEEELRELADDLLPEGDAKQYNEAIIDFGATVCKNSSPVCEECFATQYCHYFNNQVCDR